MTSVNNVNIFEVAVREKMRFQFKGVLSVEDLWDLSLTSLDSIFKTLNSQLKQVNEESLLQAKTPQDQELDTKIKIVKHIFQVKQEEANVKLKAKELKEKKQKVMEILARKQDASLENMSEKELEKMLNDLG